MVNQRDIEVTKLRTDIQRGSEEGVQLTREIDICQKNLREAHQVKDMQHERIY